MNNIKLAIAFVSLVWLNLLSTTSFSQQSPAIIRLKNTGTAIPEGIAFDRQTGKLYISSINLRKIYVATPDGQHADFIKTGEYGFGEGLGLRIDQKRNSLWALSNRKDKDGYISQAHVFDLSTRKLKQVFTYKDSVNFLFNDLAVDPQGNAWITATNGSKIFYADIKSSTLHVGIDDSLVRYPNGIELYKDRLYIATYGHGPVIYDPGTKQLHALTGYSDQKMAHNLDGLAIFDQRLFGIYNTDSLQQNNAVVAYTLNDKGDSIIKEEIIAKGHPEFREPTTMSLGENKLYVLATSNLGAYNANRESVKGIETRLSPVTVIVYSLGKEKTQKAR